MRRVCRAFPACSCFPYEYRQTKSRIFFKELTQLCSGERECKNKRYKKSKATLTHGNLAAQLTSVSSAANRLLRIFFSTFFFISGIEPSEQLVTSRPITQSTRLAQTVHNRSLLYCHMSYFNNDNANVCNAFRASSHNNTM